jgi:hypothetical protein
VKRRDEDDTDGVDTPQILRMKFGGDSPTGDQWRTLPENTHARELEKDRDVGRTTREQRAKFAGRPREPRAIDTDNAVRELAVAYLKRHPKHSHRTIAKALAPRLHRSEEGIRKVLRKLERRREI